MRFFLPTLALVWAGAFAPFILTASSIIPFTNLGEATNYSESVVLARVVESFETIENGSTFHESRLESIESVKGTLLPGSKFVLRPLSHTNGALRLDITGDFKPEMGKTYLLFLYQFEDVWRPVMLSYYVFEQFQVGSAEFLVPVGGEGIEVITRPDGLSVDAPGVLQQNIFLDQLKAFAASPQMVWDENVGRSTLRKEDFEAGDRAVPTGCDFTLGGPNLSRWQNAAIPIAYDDTNNPSGWSGTFSNILSALNDNYTGIDPADAGSKSYVPNCVGGSAIGGNFLDFCDANLGGAQCALIIFDDPCNQIPDLSNCAGTLAFGGSYSTGTFHTFDGQNWEDAVYGFVVVNNGVPACLNSTQYEQMLTHELTHVYRMGHLNSTNYPNQNMNPVCCKAINSKDRECMNYAYPAPAPVELLSFEARLSTEQQVNLKWVTESENDNDFFTIQRSANGIQYDMNQQIASSGNHSGATYEWVDRQPLAGINYYRLSQTDFDGTLKALGIKAVNVEKSDSRIVISPSPVEGDVLAFSISIQDDFDGLLEVFDTDGKIVLSTSLSLEKGPQQVRQPLSKLPAGVYFLRLFNGQQPWTARFLKQ